MQIAKRIWFTFWQILKLVLFRRFRNPVMLAMLAALCAILSGEFLASMGAPFLFWHDNVIARGLGLMGVGVFIEEWVYVAFLLDSDANNPGKHRELDLHLQEGAEELPGEPADTTDAPGDALAARDRAASQPIQQKLPSTKYVQETIELIEETSDQRPNEDDIAEEVYDYTKNLHTYATFFLCIVVSLSSYLWFSWYDVQSTFFYWKHWTMFFSAIYFPVAGAFMVFLIRKSFNTLLEKENNRLAFVLDIPVISHAYQLAIGERSLLDIPGVSHLIQLIAKLTMGRPIKFESSSESIGTEFKRFHQIALGKNLIFSLVLLFFSGWFWFIDSTSSRIPAVFIFFVFVVALLVFVIMKIRDPETNQYRNWQWWLAVSMLAFLPLITAFNFEDARSSVALIAAVLLTLLVGANGWIVFQSRRLWFEGVVVLMLVGGWVCFKYYDRIPQTVQMYTGSADEEANIVQQQNKRLLLDEALEDVVDASSVTDEATLNRWRQQFQSKPNSNFEVDNNPILVVIANSGGGIKAQVWSAAVISALEKVINEELRAQGRNPNDGFHKHVRLVTGTSGGMVGAAYWVATLENRQKDGSFHFDRSEDGKQKKKMPITSEQLIYAMSRDALDNVARQYFYNDLMGYPYNMIKGENRLDARGKGLEDALGEHGAAFDRPVSDLAAGENAGWRPTLAFAPAVANDGRRFLISNQPLEHTLVSRLSTGSGQHINSVSGYSWRTSFPGSTLSLGQAARLNANFPLFVDSPKVPFNPPLRIMDAGYIDNYGLAIASEWLLRHEEWLKKNTSKVLLVQISAARLERGESLNSKPLKIAEPGGFVTSSFNKTLHHMDASLARFAESYNDGDPKADRFRMINFEYEGDASLTWYLSNKEKFSLIYPFLSPNIINQFGGEEPETEEELALVPLMITQKGDLRLKVIRWEARQTILRIKEVLAKEAALVGEDETLDEHEAPYRNLGQSRIRIRKDLKDLQNWWSQKVSRRPEHSVWNRLRRWLNF